MKQTFITPLEASRLFGYAPETLRKKYRAGDIKIRRTSLGGRKIRYCKEELEKLFIHS